MYESMSPEQFGKAAGAYYGQYSPAVAKAVYDYLSRLSHELIRALWETVKRRHSTQYRVPPDVAILEDCRREALEFLDSQMRQPLGAEYQLEAPTGEELGRGEQAEFMRVLSRALAEGRDPREDDEVRRMMEQHGQTVSQPGDE
jgi:hypothetical protein